MRRNAAENKMVLPVILVFLFAFGPMIFVGCKKDSPQEAQQTVEPREIEAVSPSEPNEPPDQIAKAGPTEKIGLRILYAGLSDTDREKDFVEFLTKHFQQVETTDYNTFTGSHTTDFDVAIVDHNGVGFRVPIPNMSRQYSRATVTLGVPGAHLCSRLSLKTGYL